MKRVLFILKKRNEYGDKSYLGSETGLYNSASFCDLMLSTFEYVEESKIVSVLDNNDIDREVSKFNPTHVIIEALWVIPEKFVVLNKLHPMVKWIVRIHSNIPFLSSERISFKWIQEYLTKDNVYVAVNSTKILSDLNSSLKCSYYLGRFELDKIIYLPNFYPQCYTKKKINQNDNIIKISCFGAIRPLKNHLLQAIAAIRFADKINKRLFFYINVGRIEGKGESILENLEELFLNSKHTLVKIPWSNRKDFLKTCSDMDLGLQVSMSETFNIVAADLISQGIPVVGSSEIPWLSSLFAANPTDTDNIISKLNLSYFNPKLNIYLNQSKLTSYTDKTSKIWNKFLR